MGSYRTEVQHLHFNAATQSFEAMVVMYEGHETIRYPISIRLPITSDFSFVTHKLVAQAKKLRRQNAGQLISRTARSQSRLAHLGDLARNLSQSLEQPKGQYAA